jgi:DNA-binding IclR family transcriptional regulator
MRKARPIIYQAPVPGNGDGGASSASVEPPSPDQRGVQSIEVGGRVLEVLVASGQLMMLRDLAKLADITAAQAHAYLVSLRKMGLVEQDRATGRYRLGPFALSLGLSRLRLTDAYQLTTDALPAYVERLGMMGTITVWGTHGPTVVLVHESANQVHVNIRAGTVFSLTGTATGTLFAALLPPKKVQPLIRSELRRVSQSQRIADKMSVGAFRQICSDTRAAMYATINDRPVPGISAIAVPVIDHSEQIQLAITLIAPTRQIDTGRDSVHVRDLTRFAQSLSASLGSRSFPSASRPGARPRRQ